MPAPKPIPDPTIIPVLKFLHRYEERVASGITVPTIESNSNEPKSDGGL